MNFLQRIFCNGQKEEQRTHLPHGFFKYRLPGGRLVRAYNPPPVAVTHYDEGGRPHSRTVASPFGIVFPAPAMFALGGRDVRLDPKQPLNVVELPYAQGRIMNFGGAFIADSDHGLWDGEVSYGS
jgi:hypothetical protein